MLFHREKMGEHLLIKTARDEKSPKVILTLILLISLNESRQSKKLTSSNLYEAKKKLKPVLNYMVYFIYFISAILGVGRQCGSKLGN